MKEKLWAVALLALLLLACACAARAEEPCAHSHTTSLTQSPIVEAVGTDAVCTRSTAVTVVTCDDCGAIVTETQEATESAAHVFGEAQVVSAPSCTEDGETKIVCAVCGYTKKTSEAATGHEKTVLLETRDATCAEEGFSRYHCGVCGEDWSETTAKQPHDFHWTLITHATCATNQDESACVCVVCGEDSGLDHLFTENLVDHSPVCDDSLTKEPTCGEAGMKYFRCGVCGEVVSWEELPALVHAFLWQTTREPTCEEDGVSVYQCLNCGAEEEQTTIVKLGHRWKTVAAEDNGCEKEGHSEYEICDREGCGAENPEKPKTVYPALAHSFTEPVPGAGQEPTCTEDGYGTMKCANVSFMGVPCEETAETTVPALGHQHGEEWTTVLNATCAAPGEEVNRCLVCGEDEISREIPVLAHQYPSPAAVSGDHSLAGEQGAVTREPACRETGAALVACAVCGEGLIEMELPALGHKMGEWVVDEERSEPTCEEDKISIRKCERCDYKEAKTDTAALGHSWTETAETIPATCTESGLLYAVCERCGKEQSGVEIPATGHQYVETEIPSTCARAGASVFTCAACGDSYEEPREKLPHSYDGGKVTRAATCTEEGLRTYTCAVCGAIRTEGIPMAAHSYALVVVREATAAEKGEQVEVCEVCGAQGRRMERLYENMLYYKPITGVGIAVSALDESVVSKARAVVVDMTADGVYEYDLVAMNKYRVGTMTVAVRSGEITISTAFDAYGVYGQGWVYGSVADICAGNGAQLRENASLTLDSPVALIVYELVGNVDTTASPLYEEKPEVVQAMWALLQPDEPSA